MLFVLKIERMYEKRKSQLKRVEKGYFLFIYIYIYIYIYIVNLD